MRHSYWLPVGLLLLAGLVAVADSADKAPAAKQSTAAKQSPKAAEPDKAAVERSRKTVRMLDEIYKQTIVLITDKYVKDDSDFPAGGAAVILFANLTKGGSHAVRLIDASGEPSNDENVAKSAFEKEGIKRLKAGAPSYDEVISKDGKNQLHAITAVPVVMEKCILCHANYKQAKKGEAIGAISYVVPIE